MTHYVYFRPAERQFMFYVKKWISLTHGANLNLNISIYKKGCSSYNSIITEHDDLPWYTISVTTDLRFYGRSDTNLWRHIFASDKWSGLAISCSSSPSLEGYKSNILLRNATAAQYYYFMSYDEIFPFLLSSPLEPMVNPTIQASSFIL
jgi:hypothetical protein